MNDPTQRKRQRILELHRKLHKTHKRDSSISSQDEFPEYIQPQREPALKKVDVRKILGDPLPLPYLIPNTRSSTPASPAIPQFKQEVKSEPTPHFQQRRYKTLAHNDSSERLKASIQNMLKIPAHPGDTDPPSRELEDFMAATPEAKPVQRLQEAMPIMGQGEVLPPPPRFSTPSPLGFTRRITDVREKDRILKEFREQLHGEEAKPVRTKKVRSNDSTTMALMAMLFILLVTAIYGLLQSS